MLHEPMPHGDTQPQNKSEDRYRIYRGRLLRRRRRQHSQDQPAPLSWPLCSRRSVRQNFLTRLHFCRNDLSPDPNLLRFCLPKFSYIERCVEVGGGSIFVLQPPLLSWKKKKCFRWRHAINLLIK